MDKTTPSIIDGNIAVDDRGSLSFVNNFDFKDVKRFYTVSNFEKGFVRAWHGHKQEAKYVYVVSGAAIACCIPLDVMTNYQNHVVSTDEAIKNASRFVLDSRKPSVLHVPAGYCNGFRTMTADTIVMFLSTATLDQSKGDDYRFDASLLGSVWHVKER